MPNEEKMTLNERRKYLRMQQKRYYAANRKERGRLLDEMGAVTGLHRKALIRLMRSDLKRKLRYKQRGRSYGSEVDDALRVILESYDGICAERLVGNLDKMAAQLQQHGEMVVTEALLAQLKSISMATIKRRLCRIRQDELRLKRSRPFARNEVARSIPMRRIAWDEPIPGHFETDLVHHCGPVADGQYAHTLQMLDVTTGWSERRAILGRSQLVVQDAFRCIRMRLPFPVLEIHPDNGTEFLNQPLTVVWAELFPMAELSRSRPYQKNDNRFVEQKNDSLVRNYFGFDRLDTVLQVQLMNQIYDKMWLYYNFFLPVLRLKDKQFLGQPGSLKKIKRRYDIAQTPFERLSARSVLSTVQKIRLEQLCKTTNPRQLHREIQALLDQLHRLPDAVQGNTEDVRLTLGLWKSGQKTTAHFPTGSTTAAEPIIPLPKGEGCPVTLSFEPTIPLGNIII